VTILLADVLPRHSFTAGLLEKLLKDICLGNSVHKAWLSLRCLLSLESAYGILRRARDRLGDIRSLLTREHPAPESEHTDPLLQTVEHLRCVFPAENNAIAAFQVHFQRPILG